MDARRPAMNLEQHAPDRRLRFGVAALFFGLMGAVWMQHAGMAGRARLALVPLFLIGAYGLFAGLSKTCAVMALRGYRVTGCGPERIADRCELTAVRKRAAAIAAATLVATLLAVALLAWPR